MNIRSRKDLIFEEKYETNAFIDGLNRELFDVRRPELMNNDGKFSRSLTSMTRRSVFYTGLLTGFTKSRNGTKSSCQTECKYLAISTSSGDQGY